MEGSIVNLNVGGQHFSTTLSTLSVKGENFFTALLSQRFDSQKDKKGRFFIDRSPDLFVVILDFLRTGKLTLRGMDEESVRAEALFYGIEIPRPNTAPSAALHKTKEMAWISVTIQFDGGQKTNICYVYSAFASRAKADNNSITNWAGVTELFSVAAKEGWKVDSLTTERPASNGSRERTFVWALSRE
jgi:hypothetical protein